MSYEKFKAEFDQFTKNAEEFKAYHEKRIAEGLEQLEQWEPRWKSSAVMKHDMRQMMDWAADKFGGTTRTDLEGVSDPRVIYCMWLAMLQDRGLKN